jgi:hypothetical protein
LVYLFEFRSRVRKGEKFVTAAGVYKWSGPPKLERCKLSF